jgi:hypothetical protein
VSTRRYKLRGKLARCTAYHEAGHAVTNTLLGRAVRYVTIVPANGLRGHTQEYLSRGFKPAHELARPRSDRLRRQAEVEIMGSVAGPLAEARLRLEGKDPEVDEIDEWIDVVQGACSDLDKIETHVSILGFGLMPEFWFWGDDDVLEEFNPLMHCLRRRTEELLEDNWATVTTVAEMLLVEHTLNARRIRELMDGAVALEHGTVTASQLRLF